MHILCTAAGVQFRSDSIPPMASIAKLPGRRFWFAFYRDAAGRQHCKSTKLEHSPIRRESQASELRRSARNKRLATEIALRLEEAERGNVVESHLRKVLAEISERVNSQRLEFAGNAELPERLGGPRRADEIAGHGDAVQGNHQEVPGMPGRKAEAALADITPQDVQKFVEARLWGGRNANDRHGGSEDAECSVRAGDAPGLDPDQPGAGGGCAKGGEGEP